MRASWSWRPPSPTTDPQSGSTASGRRTASRGSSSSCPTADVARALGAQKREGQVLVAFGAETGAAGLERKRQMLDDKNVDLVVYNDVGRADIGFDAADNEVVLVRRDGDRHVPRAPKSIIAAEILDEVEQLLDGQP